MKLATTKDRTLLFRGNCKDSRIKKALIILEAPDTDAGLLRQIVASKYDTDNCKIRKYARAIQRSQGQKIIIGGN
jgi:hypothetical protein